MIARIVGPLADVAKRLASDSFASRLALSALGAVLASCADAASPPSVQDPPQPDAVMVWGQGLYRIDLDTLAVTTWLDETHTLEDVCWLSDHGSASDTVFVIEHGRPDRLYADSGRPVVAFAEDGLPAAPVVAPDVIDFTSCGGSLGVVLMDAPGEPAHKRRAYRDGSYPSMAFSGAARDPVRFHSGASFQMEFSRWESQQLDAVPDRSFGNTPLERAGSGFLYHVQFSPPDGIGPRLWSKECEAPRPLPPPLGERWRAVDFEMPPFAPRCFALVAATSGATRLVACGFLGDLSLGRWRALEVEWPQSIPPIEKLYLCTSNGTTLVVGNDARLDVIDADTGARRCSLAVGGVLEAGASVRDACIVQLPHDDARPAYAHPWPLEYCDRDDAWVCGLVSPPEESDGHTRLGVWDLATGALLDTIDVPNGVTRVTTLPVDTTP
jgi:hypothetical protein